MRRGSRTFLHGVENLHACVSAPLAIPSRHTEVRGTGLKGVVMEMRHVRTGAVVVGLLTIIALTMGACSSSGGSGSPTSTASLPPSTVQTTPKTESTTTLTPPSTEAGYPVLTALPEIPIDQLALIEIQAWAYDQTGQTVLAPVSAPEVRMLSPNGDADAVNALLLAYEGIQLRPVEGYPAAESPTVHVVFRMVNGDTIQVSTQDGVDRVEVAAVPAHMTGESAAPSAVGYSKDFVAAAADIGQAASREFSAGFALPRAMPDDFSLLVAYGVTQRNVLDTATGLFTKDLIVAGSISTGLSLSREELAAVYADLRALDPGGYAGIFHPARTTDWVHTPCESYYLHIRVAGQDKEISWKDEDDSTAPDAVALRDLLKKIKAMIEAKPEYQALPPAEGGYA
jgi:hypothetical protein